MVPKHGASCFASTDGSISSPCVASISLRTSGSLGCTGVFVIRCQKHVRSRTACGRDAHGVAAVYDFPWIVSVAGAIVGSALCTIFGSSYVPGTFALIGSPLPDVWKMTYWAFALDPHMGSGGAASARRGFRRKEAGSPVARARSPTYPAPKSVDMRA